MWLTYIGIVMGLVAAALFTAALICFYQGKIVKTQKQLACYIYISLSAIAVGIVFCFIGTFILK